MKISLFYEFALPRPWAPDDEHVLLQECLDEVEAADKAGFSTVWLTEHHFLDVVKQVPRRPRKIQERAVRHTAQSQCHFANHPLAV